MDQITISDIPLPGEEFSFKTDNQATEAADDVSNADLKPEELKQPIVGEEPLQEVDTTEIPDNIELNNQTVETAEPSSETLTNEIEKNISESTDSELKPETIVTETEPIVTETDPIVTETEPIVTETDPIVTETDPIVTETEPIVTESELIVTETEPIVTELEPIVTKTEPIVTEAELIITETESIASEQDVREAEVECVTSDVITETVEELQMEVERVVSESNSEVEEQVVELDAEPIVEELPTSAVEEQIIEENNQIGQPSSPKPAKKITRTNSTIEAIKNDWADTLTIEEMNEEAAVNKQVDEVVVEVKEAEVDEAKQEPEPEPEPEPVVTEPDDDIKPLEVETATSGITSEVLVLETVNEEIVASVAENVTIEIIEQAPIVKVEEAVSGVKRKASRTSQRLGAKEDRLQIPCHVLGRNVDNPTEDLISNGRTPPKPRLGVKVPYRFLTSQIVSKEEIADELLELTSKRNPAPDPPAGGDIFFASKLTQRLASKIANKQKNEATSGIPSDAMTSTSQPTTAANNTTTIGDNSDLLAILEGDVDVDWAKEVSKTSEAAAEDTETKVVNEVKQPIVTEVVATGARKLDPEMERQLALKQLREMPMKKEGRGRPRKHHHLYESKSYQAKYMEGLAKMKDVLIKEPKPAAPPPPKKQPEPEQQVVVVTVSKETNENIKQAVNKLAKKMKENEMKVEPDPDLNLNPKRVTKTYSRKEAVLDVPAELEYIVNEPEQPQPPPPSALADTPPSPPPPPPPKSDTKKNKRSAADINKPEVTLVSKRARIIKKKVIWDPAEVPKTKVLNAIRKAQALEMKARKKKQKEKQPAEEDDEEAEVDKQPLQQRQLRRNRMIPRPPTTVLTKVQKQKLLMKRQLRSLIRSANGEFRPKKKRQQPKKTELDRLLGDEGAVNMLYSVRQQGKASQRTIVTKKELLNRKKVLKDVITQSSNQEVTPKALRKKDSPAFPPARKKSRDSVRSSLQSPPPSPSYFQHHSKGAEASRIIRRHSSSFSSDCSSPRRLSVDTNKVEETPVTRVLRRKTIQQPPPPPAPPGDADEKLKKADSSPVITISGEREKLSVAEKRKLNAEMSKNFDKTPKKRTRSSKGELGQEGERLTNVQTEYKEILLKKSNNFYQIVMNSPANAKLKNVISLQMFQELGSALIKLAKDESCKVVALTSSGKSFCRGLDFSNLIQTTAEKRSTAAQEMSKALKEFIQTLAKFPKPLLACLHSSTCLLGTTMLPYFDAVLCADTATLSGDYSRVGHGPEGAPAVALGPRVGPALAADLLLLGRRLTAKEAMDCGLVARVEKPDKLEEALHNMAAELAEKSHQCWTATKSVLRQPLLEKLDGALDLEAKLLIEHWVNPECQQNFKKLLQEEELW